MLWLWAEGGEGSPTNLLSDQVGFVVCLDFEAAVVGPEIHGDADASDTALVDLRMLAQFNVCRPDRVYSPFPLLRFPQSRIPCPHISSRSRRIEGISRGIGRRLLVSMRSLVGSSCGLGHLLALRRHEPAFPNGRIPRGRKPMSWMLACMQGIVRARKSRHSMPTLSW